MTKVGQCNTNPKNRIRHGKQQKCKVFNLNTLHQKTVFRPDCKTGLQPDYSNQAEKSVAGVFVLYLDGDVSAGTTTPHIPQNARNHLEKVILRTRVTAHLD